jgi:hypothetical protein
VLKLLAQFAPTSPLFFVSRRLLQFFCERGGSSNPLSLDGGRQLLLKDRLMSYPGVFLQSVSHISGNIRHHLQSTD